MIDPELRDLKCGWERLPGAPREMEHFVIYITYGSGEKVELIATEKQAQKIAQEIGKKWPTKA